MYFIVNFYLHAIPPHEATRLEYRECHFRDCRSHWHFFVGALHPHPVEVLPIVSQNENTSILQAWDYDSIGSNVAIVQYVLYVDLGIFECQDESRLF